MCIRDRLVSRLLENNQLNRQLRLPRLLALADDIKSDINSKGLETVSKDIYARYPEFAKYTKFKFWLWLQVLNSTWIRDCSHQGFKPLRPSPILGRRQNNHEYYTADHVFQIEPPIAGIYLLFSCSSATKDWWALTPAVTPSEVAKGMLWVSLAMSPAA